MGDLRLFLVDDHPGFLRALTGFLEAADGLAVVGSVTRGAEAVLKIGALRPDVVLVDLLMPGLPGLEIIPRLRAARPEMGIIALTLLETDDYRRAALTAGADDFVTKATMDTTLVPAIRRVARARGLGAAMESAPGTESRG